VLKNKMCDNSEKKLVRIFLLWSQLTTSATTTG